MRRALAALALAALVLPARALEIERIFREPVYLRGNANIRVLQPVDEADWVWGEDAPPPQVLRFECRFTVAPEEPKLVFDVSADQRYYLTLDGEFVARGPHRGTVEDWQYETYAVKLPPGEHVFAATVWQLGEHTPLAQLSWRGGFIFRAEGDYDARLTTGKAPWRVAALPAPRPLPAADDAWRTGPQWELDGCGAESARPTGFGAVRTVRAHIGGDWRETFGLAAEGWRLFPSQLPDLLEHPVLPGRVRALAEGVAWQSEHVYSAAETNVDFALNRPFVVPAHTRRQLAWDLGDYYCAYPELMCSRGRGARIALVFSEAPLFPGTRRKGGETGSRGEIVGKFLSGNGEVFVADGSEHAVFTSPVFRAGRWCRIDIETGDEPLAVDRIRLLETRYPLDAGATFVADDPSLGDIRTLAVRTLAMCAHDTIFDCPYYERLMYPGDMRLAANVLSVLGQDERLGRRALEIFDLALDPDGLCPFSWPNRTRQRGGTYSLVLLLAYGDYALRGADREWLRSRLVGMRHLVSGLSAYENGEGLLEALPGWNFVDWARGWNEGVVPGSGRGKDIRAVESLLWVLALRSAAQVERALENETEALVLEAHAERVAAAAAARFWCRERGLFADTARKNAFSEHVQALAILAGLGDELQRAQLFRHLLIDTDLVRCTTYFDYYLFEAYFKMGRPDLFLAKLSPWRGYLRKGMTTASEEPDAADGGRLAESRSDCHAWGSHPAWFMATRLAGVAPDAPFFGRVRVAPQPGPLGHIEARCPHPQGWIELKLDFHGRRATGKVVTPVAGVFVYGAMTNVLTVGENRLR